MLTVEADNIMVIFHILVAIFDDVLAKFIQK